MNHLLPVGVCVLPESGLNTARTVTYPNYIFEILQHAGVFHQPLAMDEIEPGLTHLRLLITVGDATFPESLKSSLSRWVEDGGAWLSIAGTCAMDALLGATPVEPELASWRGGPRSLGEGYLITLDPSHPALTHVTRPLHFFGGSTVVATGAMTIARADGKHGQITDRPAILERVVGKGRTLLIAPDLTGAIVRIQQGVGVTRDGVPAADGTGAVDDHLLKADDGAVLDWDFDRDRVPGVAANFRAFLTPIADLWREVLLRSIFYLAREHRVPLSLLWLYPRKLPALAHISHDSDENQPNEAHELLRLLDETNIKTTWCIILPGYDAVLTAKIKSAGHELATHYDAASEGCEWSQHDWQRQHRALCDQFGERPVSNKNHGSRWEGDTEFFDWCVDAGIQLDQTKSPSKTGECGFTFGTCHPYFPVTYRGRTIDCLELCTHFWDVPAWAPIEVFEPLLESVRRHHGILHHLCHPFHTIKPQVAQAVRLIVRRAREEGLEWWTARQINDWERARRGVRVERCASSAHVFTLTLRSAKRLNEATLLTLRTDGAAGNADFIAWGFAFEASVQTLEPDRDIVIQAGPAHSPGRSEK